MVLAWVMHINIKKVCVVQFCPLDYWAYGPRAAQAPSSWNSRKHVMLQKLIGHGVDSGVGSGE